MPRVSLVHRPSARNVIGNKIENIYICIMHIYSFRFRAMTARRIYSYIDVYPWNRVYRMPISERQWNGYVYIAPRANAQFCVNGGSFFSYFFLLFPTSV